MRRLLSRLTGMGFAAALLVCCATRARASYEEFSTLDIAHEENDDENLLDHVLVRPPLDWAEEWRNAKGAFRTSEGCFTAAQWYLDHELKLQVPMGDTTYMELGIRDVSDDESAYGWTQFDLRFPIRHTGLWGLRFRPSFDKSRQDLGLLWDYGNDRRPLHIQAVMGMEDMFNKFWSLRQVRVGADSEPYTRHPYEPALHIAWRGAGPHFEANVTWLTPSRKHFLTIDTTQRRLEYLWGMKHNASLSQKFGDYSATVALDMVQASRLSYWDEVAGDHHMFQRRWLGEGMLQRRVGEHGSIALRYFYQERTHVLRPPISDLAFGVIDRMPMIEGSFRAPLNLGLRVGFLRNRVTVARYGGQPTWVLPFWTQGTRVETRAFFSIQKQWGRVRLMGTEGIEFDHEPYPVAFHHDKGFLHVQTTF